MAFTYPFCYKPIPEIVSAAKELMRKIASEPELDDFFSEGKMLGVLMVAEKSENGLDGGQENGGKEMRGGKKSEGGTGSGSCKESECDQQSSVSEGDGAGDVNGGKEVSDQQSSGSSEQAGGKVKFLYAFSGLAGGRSIIEGFVPPIFDLNAPGSEYRAREAEISALNRRIRELEGADCKHIDASTSSAAAEAPEVFIEAPNGANATQGVRGVRSPVDKMALSDAIASLKARRRELSISLQDWLFRQYRVLNARGEWSSIREIFERRGIMPPGGTGDCAAPKLLQYAYLHKLQPLALGEFWYGAPPLRELRLQGCFYPACTGKCGPLLEYMMQGLDVEPNPLERDDSEFTAQLVIYSDDDIVVANKPAGMLSVPGRTASNSLLTLLRRRFGEDLQSCHRLDMDTSGVMVFARGLRNKSLIEKQFAEHSARKTYVARLISLPAADAANAGVDAGRIELPLIVDWDDRPRQMIDYEDGKEAVTDYVVIGRRPNGEIDVRFTPRTGRTHQLRVHAAHPAGLGRPIKGDRLYGAHPDSPASRLYLHAESLTFRHPATGEELTFTVPAAFPEE